MSIGRAILGQEDQACRLFQEAMAPSDKIELTPNQVIEYGDDIMNFCCGRGSTMGGHIGAIVDIFGRGKPMALVASQSTPDVMKFLLDHPSGRFRITQDVILSVARNPRATDVMGLFQKQYRRELEFNIKSSLFEKVASCQGCAGQFVMTELLKYRKARLSDRTYETAARNSYKSKDGKSMLGLLLSTSTSTKRWFVSENIAKAAATNCQTMLELLTNESIYFHVTEDVMVAITNNPDPPRASMCCHAFWTAMALSLSKSLRTCCARPPCTHTRLKVW